MSELNFIVKRLKIITVFIASLFSFSQLGFAQGTQKTFETRKADVIEILKKNVANGLPGAAISFSSPQGDWTYSEGYANLENKQPLTNDNLHYLQSVSKLYMAVAILKLSEEGKIKLSDDISKYLDPKQAGLLTTRGITVKMLLNHTSGIPEYATKPKFVTFVLEHPLQTFDVWNCVYMVKNEPLDFAPGTQYAYSNTNYTLLSLIADKITGNHVKYLEKVIFKPLGLTQTHYLTAANYRKIEGIADSYWDVLNIEKPANITNIQKVNVASLRGDDGIVCATSDAVKFMKGLVQGKILKPETLALMQQFVSKDGRKRYGLGLEYYDLGTTYAIGHSGGGIGAGCVLMYLPELDSYVFLATNFTTLIESKISTKCQSIQTDILMALFM
ncbi:serine hydrolase domain-containing protein [Flavobacterium wongokense]|uniref:serine hydrolase domain-containing protein n=1 Tax=Flavobacterium wongokense TaxID=2910674 RepID=UPI001F2AB1E4|nr:serine hydrolase domain-containing protein [Flavobacterium sp. WG47]MCF6132318.1 beta-lactamase family protein [Flavobacterium sp. WG47]